MLMFDFMASQTLASQTTTEFEVFSAEVIKNLNDIKAKNAQTLKFHRETINKVDALNANLVDIRQWLNRIDKTLSDNVQIHNKTTSEIGVIKDKIVDLVVTRVKLILNEFAISIKNEIADLCVQLTANKRRVATKELEKNNLVHLATALVSNLDFKLNSIVLDSSSSSTSVVPVISPDARGLKTYVSELLPDKWKFGFTKLLEDVQESILSACKIAEDIINGYRKSLSIEQQSLLVETS
ncbi:hypothetical protein HK096_006674 [Nowakowskiella sp. JEL0078]|nr:hypothetical protein HK096_006674 [Nowakowskiella sp. JEL0078]